MNILLIPSYMKTQILNLSSPPQDEGIFAWNSTTNMHKTFPCEKRRRKIRIEHQKMQCEKKKMRCATCNEGIVGERRSGSGNMGIQIAMSSLNLSPRFLFFPFFPLFCICSCSRYREEREDGKRNVFWFV